VNAKGLSRIRDVLREPQEIGEQCIHSVRFLRFFAVGGSP
jgi:hypothetical protein